MYKVHAYTFTTIQDNYWPVKFVVQQNQGLYVLLVLGLKTFSNWPTYPQLYIKGELTGGLDIIKELIESGEFDSMVPKKEKLEER